MSFADRLTRLPRPHDPDRAEDARAILTRKGPVGDLLAGAGGSSPYLLSLMQKEADWLPDALSDPETALKAEFARLRGVERGHLPSALRQGKRRIALLIALADLGGVWPLEEVTGHLTAFADLACDLALQAALAPLVRRGKLPGMDEESLATGCGMVILAMGKMGAGELNYSSDIDLISLFDETRYDPDDYAEARAACIRATRTVAATLSEMTGEGYVFRTDLRLRPDPSVTPVCLSLDAAERYYESLGRTWERAAYIKARPCAGDLEAGERFLTALRPFVWRRHLDYAAIQDAHDMRQAIRDHKGHHGDITLPGHDMKLGRGGIREIEFFAQFHQIIAGGRDPDLRVRSTVEALRLLTVHNWIPEDITEKLVGHYRALREVEHRIQMVNDAQTHALPQTDPGLDRIAALSAQDPDDFRRDLRARLEEVHGICEQFFARDTGKARDEAPEAEADFDSETIARWRGYPALRSQRAQNIFQRLKPRLLAALSRSARPDEALSAFDGFLAGLPAGVQLFSLFEANPQLIDLLADIAGTAPELARYLSRNASVFDAVIGGSFFDPWPDADSLAEDLSALLKAEEDYEKRLDAARRWQKEWHFRVGVHHLRGLIGAADAAQHYTDIADATLRALWPAVQEEFALRHGAPPGRGAMVLGMGSLGARRLNARSDLDLIIIYDPQEAEGSDGRRPLATRTYYARLTQALVTALSAPTAAGRLYEVDMRLRPSGNQGPVATSWSAFRNYQDTEAWTWEHLALTLARPVAGPPDFMRNVEDFRRRTLSAAPNPDRLRRDLAEMRARIASAKGQGGAWDMKIGRGKAQDIELLAQAGTLAAGEAGSDMARGLAHAADAGWIDEVAADQLTEAWRSFRNLTLTARLLTDRELVPGDLGRGGCDFLLREVGAETLDELKTRLDGMVARSGDQIDAALKTEPDDG
ncbi:glutamate-ammonia ligase adenylyltransferase [Pseudooceanicola batsensis HTCC2597]|uniref:Glutamate-ammonia ligase adenylyltransferase n=1 Tax=Pseudooceanicola batsensis (strain ATCC BAA-863 / DSM 15984 / KCTC 12145 / HTCC2597) TaxID=252305 RepID=A3TWZ8_PSEBH|nr:bifunctional [glutamine synthetase] adenylyltransferase/[glutamine synthetase]-adenylyl-L-tyrosine phosphorylase [Pseudooceanicola batsensis]EAQ03358.1 glutamate-ammonia ligase adenylyltransferase [Pseudooceanicola batsensis HTCC2597]